MFVEFTEASFHAADGPVARFVIVVVAVKLVDDNLVFRPYG